ALTIAGSDPSGGAGIQADLKTFHQFGVYGEAAITLITVQNTLGVSRVEVLPPDLIVQQIQAVIDDLPPQAAKTGALGNAAVVKAIAALAEMFQFPLIVDPVMIGKHGAPLLDEDAREALIHELIPRATLLTPNIPEAEVLTGLRVTTIDEMKSAAERLLKLGAKSVVIKGGHAQGPATDILLHEGEWYEFPAARIATRHTHGTGCTFSAAITAELARSKSMTQALACAKKYVTEAIKTTPELGRGTGPVNHWAEASA
ncbi:MAG: bifunctional hydroxymethylpyrimidine kinase/phosphomethylpyrimidine kinase, partial [Bryobacteraceae bacterium]